LFPATTAAARAANPAFLASLYVGIAALAFATTGIATGLNRRGWTALALAGLVLGLGSHTPVLPFLYESLPALFAKFRYPEKFWFWVHLSLAILAAQGVQAIDDAHRRFSAVTCLVALAAIAALTVSLAASSDLIAPRDVVRVATVVGAAFGLVWYRTRGILGELGFIVGVVGVALVDLVSARGPLWTTLAWRDLRQQQPVVDVAELARSHRRIFHYQARPTAMAPNTDPGPGLERWPIAGERSEEQATASNLWATLFADVGMVYGVASLDGGEGLSPSYLRTLLDLLPRLEREDAVRLLGAFSVEYLIGPDPRPSPALDQVAGDRSPFYVYRLQSSLPVAYIVGRLRVLDEPSSALEALASRDFALGREAVVERLPAGWTSEGPDPRDAGEVTAIRYADDEIELRVVCRGPAFLVLNEAWFPGWEARVDDVPSAIVRTNAIVRGVALTSGEHRIEFRYRPASLRWGIAISGISLIVVLALAAAAGRARRA
jgi:hypothetical protein